MRNTATPSIYLLLINLCLLNCVLNGGESQLVRSNSFGRNNNLPRLPSFGKVVRFNNDGGAGSRQQDFAPHDMQRDYYGGVRRMPSFKKHRYHDAEYISMGDQYTPQASETRYVDLHHNQQQQRPTLRSEVSFSKLPVGNPNYLKQVASAYYWITSVHPTDGSKVLIRGKTMQIYDVN